jgi:hypothetical protein
VLTSVKEGDLWHMLISWPNGTTKHFGKFGSELEAHGWIGAHSWLTAHIIEESEIRRKSGRRVTSGG